MRSRAPLVLTVALVLFVLPHVAHAGIPFFGPIIPKAYSSCPGGWGLLMVVVNNIIEFLLTMAIVFVAPLMIAYSGFLFVVNPADPSGVTKARSILLNTIVGIVISLAAWMIVDAIMAVLYSPTAVGGTWASLITTRGDACLPQAGALPGAQLIQATSSPIVSGSYVGDVLGVATAQCQSSNTACSPAALRSAGLSSTQADIMSCIAMTESSGNPSLPPYNTIHPGSNSTACGTFQITQTTWNSVAPSGSCADWASTCQSPTCNLQVAATLVQRTGYNSWTCPGCNNNAAACIQKYGGS